MPALPSEAEGLRLTGGGYESRAVLAGMSPQDYPQPVLKVAMHFLLNLPCGMLAMLKGIVSQGQVGRASEHLLHKAADTALPQHWLGRSSTAAEQC